MKNLIIIVITAFVFITAVQATELNQQTPLIIQQQNVELKLDAEFDRVINIVKTMSYQDTQTPLTIEQKKSQDKWFVEHKDDQQSWPQTPEVHGWMFKDTIVKVGNVNGLTF